MAAFEKQRVISLFVSAASAEKHMHCFNCQAVLFSCTNARLWMTSSLAGHKQKAMSLGELILVSIRSNSGVRFYEQKTLTHTVDLLQVQ